MIDELVKAVLYEGYALYPYRPSALKNQKRFAFGMLFPRAYAERHQESWFARVELLMGADPTFTTNRGELADFSSTTENVVNVGSAPRPTRDFEGFQDDSGESRVGPQIRFLRLQRGGGATEHGITASGRVDDLVLEVEHTIAELGDGLVKVSVEIRNVTPIEAAADREAAVDLATASTHVVLRFAPGWTPLSAIDPPERARAATAACRCVGLYPVLVGDGAVLASPIILADQPRLAPRSPGDFFDGTEIDEMLTLRILTMTEAEKREASAADPRVAAMIARTEALGIEHTAQLHGSVHTSWPRVGTRVRLRPAGRADAFDVILAGKCATVAAVERDLDGAVHCAVTIDEDPGAHEPIGHRFYFAPDELEVIA